MNLRNRTKEFYELISSRSLLRPASAGSSVRSVVPGSLSSNVVASCGDGSLSEDGSFHSMPLFESLGVTVFKSKVPVLLIS